MKNDKDSPRRPAEKKPSPINNNILWFMIALALLTSFVVVLLTTTNSETIQYSDLLRLLKNDDGKGYVEVERQSGDKTMKVKFSRPTDIKLGSYEATGKILRQRPVTRNPRRSTSPPTCAP